MKTYITQLRADLKENLFKFEIEKFYKNSESSDVLTMYLTAGELNDVELAIKKALAEANL